MRAEYLCVGEGVLQVPVKALVVCPLEGSPELLVERVQVKRRRKGFSTIEGQLGTQAGSEPQSRNGLNFQVGVTYYVMRPAIVSQAGSDISQRVGDLLSYDSGNTIGLPCASLLMKGVVYGDCASLAGSVSTTGVIGSRLSAELKGPPNSLLVLPMPTDFS